MTEITRRNALAMTAAAAAGGLAASEALAASGQVRIRIVSAGFIVGAAGGSGTLTFGGRSYSLGIGGISVGATIGASTTELIGTAVNLRSPRDIEGVYTAAGAGAAIAGGAQIFQLSNSRGVVLKLRGRKIGLEFSIDLSGMQISLR